MAELGSVFATIVAKIPELGYVTLKGGQISLPNPMGPHGSPWVPMGAQKMPFSHVFVYVSKKIDFRFELYAKKYVISFRKIKFFREFIIFDIFGIFYVEKLPKNFRYQTSKKSKILKSRNFFVFQKLI